MNIVERDVNAYWNASSAYRGRMKRSKINNVGNLIACLRSLCLIGHWRVSSLAGKLLEDVIEDRVTINECPAEIIPLIPTGAASEYTDFLGQLIGTQFVAKVINGKVIA